MLKVFIFIIILFLLILGIVLGVLNPSAVTLNLFITQTVLPLGLILALALVIGALLGAVVSSLKISQLKWQLRKQVKANKKQLNQIVQLKKESSLKEKESRTFSNELVHLEKTG